MSAKYRSKSKPRAGPVTRTRRDLGKFLVNIYHAGTSIQHDTVLMGEAQQPGTITGLRWDIAFAGTEGSNGQGQDFAWCIYALRQSVAVPTLSLDGASALTGNLRDVIAFGSGVVVQGFAPTEEHGSTKSMRKLQRGDKLMFSFKPLGATPKVHVRGSAQFFYRT